MREQVNLVIDADVTRLDTPLPPMRARCGAGFVARVHGVPADCADVVFRVSTDGGEGFMDFPATCNSNGEWTCRIPGLAFRKAGLEWYEVRAMDSQGGETAIGRGRAVIGQWSAGTARTFDGRRRFVTTIFDELGSQHAIWAVQNDVGEWTYKVGPVGDAEAVPVDALPAPGDEKVYIRAIGEE